MRFLFKDGKTWREWIQYFEELGVDRTSAEKLADKVKVQNYDVVEVHREDLYHVGEGNQVFGSGGYHHDFKIWIPSGSKLEDIAEIVDKEGYETQFISGIWYTIKPKDKTFVISHSRGDGIGQGRTFTKEIIVYKG